MAPIAPSLQTDEVHNQAKRVFDAQHQAIYRRTDRLFALLMVLQWAGAILAAVLLSPRTWAGTASQVHPHVWAAIFLGGLISIFPICLALACPGQMITRQIIAVSQLLMSALLIHISGGQETTHFHIFGSLAFLAFYRDWRVLVTATLVTATDHLVRGALWPQSIYGLAASSPWLTAEHVGWVAFEDVFLLISCRQSLMEMHQISLRQAQLEVAEGILLRSHETLETRVDQRTQALAQMQQQNGLLLNSAGEGIYGIDAAGITQFVNPVAARLLGYEIAELIGQPMHTLLHHTHRDGSCYAGADSPIYHSMQTGNVARADSEVFWRKDGTCFDVEYIATPLWEEGRIRGAVVTFQDITERRHMAETLRQRTLELSESLQEHQNIMETVPDILFRLDLDGKLVQWNRKMEIVTSRSPEELQGKSALDFFGASERDKIAEAIAQAFQTGYVEVEGSLLGAGRQPLAHQFSAVPLRNADGVPIGLTGMGRDITERKRSEDSLRESETRYRSLVEHSPEAVVVYSEDRFVYANAAAVTLFAAGSVEDLVGRLIFDVVHPDHHVLARERATRSQEEGKSSPLTEQKYVRLDGKVIDVEAVSTGISYCGKPAGQVLIRDITERKKAQENILALNSQLLHAYDATIEGWSRALDLRDHETEGHSRRVTEMTLRLARAVGVPEDALVHIKRGALLHDIGKMGVPDSVLLKPGPLDAEEWEIMRRHPSLAREMLAPTEFLHPALDIPYCHHEKWDGTGYPRGLRGEQIPLSARLFSLVDVWDALVSDRPYRAAWPRERVLDHLCSLSGTHFDPELVAVFISLLDADAFALPLPRLCAA